MAHTFSFKCLDDKSRFSVERESSDMNQMGKIFCPSCGKSWGAKDAKIELDISPAVISKPRQNMAKENIAASQYANEAAMRDRAALDAVDPQVAPGVRKSVVDTINTRASEFI